MCDVKCNDRPFCTYRTLWSYLDENITDYEAESNTTKDDIRTEMQ